MFIRFFNSLRASDVPVSIKEWLDLLAALEARLAFASYDDFYLLARTVLIKDEKYYDRFDRCFSVYFKDIASLEELVQQIIPDEWLQSEFFKQLSEEEKQKIESLGGLEALLETFQQRMKEQKDKHKGGNKWIGTEGSSPFGNSGYNPEGIRIGGKSKQKKAVKVWDKRQFKNLDDSVELGTRNIKVALRKLRKFARTGAADQLDLDDTIKSTAKNAGLLDLKLVPERHNAVKVLLFFDVGGSMDPYVQICEELFSACKSEFKHLEYFYFHNFIYDYVWKNNRMRTSEKYNTLDILHTYSRDYRVIFVGDASMAPYEIISPYGCVEYMNTEAGKVWMERVCQSFQKIVWLNPVNEAYWQYTQSIGITQNIIENRMHPLTLAGLDEAIRYLSR